MPTLSLLQIPSSIEFTEYEYIGQLIDAHIESLRQDEETDSDTVCDLRTGYPTARVVEVWAAFETCLLDSVARFFHATEGWSLETAHDSAHELMTRDLPIAAYYSLGGAGTGVWDCDQLDAALGDCSDGPEKTREALHAWIRKSAALVAFVDITGGGSLEEALRDAAYRDTSDETEK